ncbi:MAG: tetratricopeptide repeat protein [Polyangiaceae bacterium]
MVAFIASTGVAGEAKADPKKEGDALNDEGRALSRAGKWDEAKKKFEAAYGKVGSPGPLFNLAWAEQNLGEFRAALKHYRVYLALPPTEKISADARAKAERLAGECSAKLCRFEVRGASKVKIDGEAPGDVEPGSHKIEMEGPQGPRTKTVTCAANEEVLVKYEEEKAAVPAVVPSASAVPSATTRPPDPPPAERTEKGSWVVPGVLAGVGIVGLGVGVGLGVASGSKADEVAKLEAEKPCRDPNGAECVRLTDLRSSTNGLATASVIGYVAGGALAGAAVVAALVIRPWESHKQTGSVPRVVPAVGQGFAGVSLDGRF